MSKFLVYKADALDSISEATIFYSLLEAEKFRRTKEKENRLVQWDIAYQLDIDSWVDKLLLWFKSKTSKN